VISVRKAHVICFTAFLLVFAFIYPFLNIESFIKKPQKYNKDNSVKDIPKSSGSSPLWEYTDGGAVFSVAISSDSNYIVTGTLNNKIRLFHKSSSTPIWSFTAGDNVLSVDISSNGKYIASIPGLKLFFFDIESQFNLSDLNIYTMIVLIIGVVGLFISIIIVVIRRRKLKARGIRVFISHAVDDFNKYRIAEIAKYLESHPEINHVYYCEEDLTGNIDDWMKKTVPRCQLLIFFSTENSLKSASLWAYVKPQGGTEHRKIFFFCALLQQMGRYR